MEWPPNYAGELDRRLKLEHRLTADRDLLAGALLQYAQSPADFISDCVYLYEPRHANVGEPVQLPVRAVPTAARVHRVAALAVHHEDLGAGREVTRQRRHVDELPPSPCGCGCSIPAPRWASASRKEILVDRAGDLQSIFEKTRSIVRNLPHYLKPKGFKEHTHSNYMRLLNPANDATIIGEAGDNIGRGGRTSHVFRRRGCVPRAPGAHRSGAHRHHRRAHRHLDALQRQPVQRVGESEARASSSSTSPMSPGTRTPGSRPSATSSKARA